MIDYSDIELFSLTSDLKRIALAIGKTSLATANVFAEEAQRRQQLLSDSVHDAYIAELLVKIREALISPDLRQKADDCLMYSTLLQNYILKNPLDNKNQPS